MAAGADGIDDLDVIRCGGMSFAPGPGDPLAEQPGLSQLISGQGRHRPGRSTVAR